MPTSRRPFHSMPEMKSTLCGPTSPTAVAPPGFVRSSICQKWLFPAVLGNHVVRVIAREKAVTRCAPRVRNRRPVMWCCRISGRTRRFALQRSRCRTCHRLARCPARWRCPYCDAGTSCPVIDRVDKPQVAVRLESGNRELCESVVFNRDMNTSSRGSCTSMRIPGPPRIPA